MDRVKVAGVRNGAQIHLVGGSFFTNGSVPTPFQKAQLDRMGAQLEAIELEPEAA